jgi:hypothetical protein
MGTEIVVGICLPRDVYGQQECREKEWVEYSNLKNHIFVHFLWFVAINFYVQSGGYSVARSQSAAGVARPQRARSKSPRRSLSPPADRDTWRYTGAALGAIRLCQPISLTKADFTAETCPIGPWMPNHSGIQPRTEHSHRETHVLSLRPLITTLLQLLTSSLCSTLFLFSRIFRQPYPST